MRATIPNTVLRYYIHIGFFSVIKTLSSERTVTLFRLSRLHLSMLYSIISKTLYTVLKKVITVLHFNAESLVDNHVF